MQNPMVGWAGVGQKMAPLGHNVVVVCHNGSSGNRSGGSNGSCDDCRFSSSGGIFLCETCGLGRVKFR